MGENLSREKAERRGSLVIKVMRLDEILEEHLHKDDLAGHHYVVPKEKLDRTLDSIKELINDMIVNEIKLDKNENKTLRRLLEIRDEKDRPPVSTISQEDPEETLA